MESGEIIVRALASPPQTGEHMAEAAPLRASPSWTP